ncbi:Hypothetical protein CAP_8971 [Chondromyces apiculatus DSM 436]|uniref:Uncharacterized protein n=1 Tax=Chondromyces apiculatus DSM 436 TaxID=1192034 RepID=A0A017SW20_9BACT|nr:Hypothetical protein CAP_8971 [Chondromyces apiculatus DSM 436]
MALVAAACGGAAWMAATCSGAVVKSPPSPLSPDPSPRAPALASAQRAAPEPGARLAYDDGAALCIRDAWPDRLAEARCIAHGEPILQWSWVDRERLVALRASGEVALLHDGRWQELSQPPPSTWEQPEPRDAQGHPVDGLVPSDKVHLSVRADGVWLSRCPFWIAFDAGGCHAWVNARLWPSLKVEVDPAEPPGFRDPEEGRDLPLGQRPDDVHLTERPSADGKTLALECTRGASRSALEESTEGVGVDFDWGWVGESPTSYVVRVSRDYIEVVRVSLYLMEACQSAPVREIEMLRTGPGDFWVHDDPKGVVVRHGGRALGVVPTDDVRWAPR